MALCHAGMFPHRQHRWWPLKSNLDSNVRKLETGLWMWHLYICTGRSQMCILIHVRLQSNLNMCEIISQIHTHISLNKYYFTHLFISNLQIIQLHKAHHLHFQKVSCVHEYWYAQNGLSTHAVSFETVIMLLRATQIHKRLVRLVSAGHWEIIIHNSAVGKIQS